MADPTDTMHHFAPLHIGDVVPRFTARSTQGPVDLADYDHQWIVLFAHPADFTPVCTSEFIELAKAADEFADLDCALIGISIDSLYSHLAWIRMIHEMTGVKVEFPLVEDPTMEIARAYGMISPEAGDAATVRATYFIAPGGILRASITYPPNVGRSIPEMLRLLRALQAADGEQALVPANWESGDPLLRMPEENAANLFKAKSATDWFYSPSEGRARRGD